MIVLLSACTAIAWKSCLQFADVCLHRPGVGVMFLIETKTFQSQFTKQLYTVHAR